MKTPQKGFIAPLLLILIAILLIGGGTYVYMQKKQANQSVTESPTAQATSTQDVTTDLINRISSVYSTDNSYTVVYHDDKTVAFVIAVPAGKSPTLAIADIHTLKTINTRDIYMWDSIESTNYIIGVGADYVIGVGIIGDGKVGLKYYKSGASDVEMIPNSTLPASETYVKEAAGMGSSSYEIAFDETTKTLTASVFKPNSGSPNTKIREVKFVLP